MNIVRCFIGWIVFFGLGLFSGSEVSASESLKVKDIFLADSASCAVFEDNRFKCWGLNRKNLIENNPGVRNYSVGDERDEMGDHLRYMDFPAYEIEYIGMEVASLCVHYTRGRGVYCTGYLGRIPRKAEFKTLKGQPLEVRKMRAGREHYCAIFTNDTVGCWGRRFSYNLGFPDRHNQYTRVNRDRINPIKFNAPGETPIDLAVSAYSSCVLFDSGKIRCWGGNHYGALGNESFGDYLSFNVVDLGTAGGNPGTPGTGDPLLATKIYSHSSRHGFCVEFADLSMKCWGQNNYGQLGIGSTDRHGHRHRTMGDFLPYLDFGKAGTRMGFAPGGEITCVLFVSGVPKCWGRGEFLGLGGTQSYGVSSDTIGDDIPFINLGRGRSVVKIKTGRNHACAVLNDGNVACWGSNEFGQLGQGHTQTLGNLMREMGDQLPIVDLGTK